MKQFYKTRLSKVNVKKGKSVLAHPLRIAGIIIILFAIVIKFPIPIRLREIGVCETEPPRVGAYWNVIYQDSSIEYFEKYYNVKLDFLTDIDLTKETVIFSVGAPLKSMHYNLFDGFMVKRDRKPARVGYATFKDQVDNSLYVYKTPKLNLVIPEYAVW